MTVNYTILKEDIQNIITMHLLYFHDCESTEENIINLYTFLLCGHIGPTQDAYRTTTGADQWQ